MNKTNGRLKQSFKFGRNPALHVFISAIRRRQFNSNAQAQKRVDDFA
jgi:hypothetical protein